MGEPVIVYPGDNTAMIAWLWHWMCRPGHYLVTIVWSTFARNVNAVIDDFGDLVAVE